MTPQNGDAARGPDALRALLATYCTLKPRLQITTRKVTTVGDTALLMSDWRVKTTAPDGSPVEASGTSLEVARRGADGAWRYLIDFPYGID